MGRVRFSRLDTRNAALLALCLAAVGCASTQHTAFFDAPHTFAEATGCSPSGMGSAGCCHAGCDGFEVAPNDAAGSDRRPYGFAVIEFDDHGDFREDRQLADALALVEKLRRPVLADPDARGLVLVLFTHGWKHYPTGTKCSSLFKPECFGDDARAPGCDPHEDCPADLQRFRFFLELLNDHPQMQSRVLMGVFLSWRGAVFERDVGRKGIENPAAWLGQQISFWNRAAAAEKVAGENYMRAVNQLILAARRTDCLPGEPAAALAAAEDPLGSACPVGSAGTTGGVGDRVVPLSIPCPGGTPDSTGSLVVPDVAVIAMGHSLGGKIVELALGSTSIASALSSSPAAERARWQARVWVEQADRSCLEARRQRCQARWQQGMAVVCDEELERSWGDFRYALRSEAGVKGGAAPLPRDPPEGSPGDVAREAWKKTMVAEQELLRRANDTLAAEEALVAELEASRLAGDKAIEDGLSLCRQRLGELSQTVCLIQRTIETGDQVTKAEVPCPAFLRAQSAVGACGLYSRSSDGRERLRLCVRCGVSTWERFVLNLEEDDPEAVPLVRHLLGQPGHEIQARKEETRAEPPPEPVAQLPERIADLGREGNRLRGLLEGIRLPAPHDAVALAAAKARAAMARAEVASRASALDRLLALEAYLPELDQLADSRERAIARAERSGEAAESGFVCSTRLARQGYRELSQAVSPVADVTLLVNPASPALTTRAVSEALKGGVLVDTLNEARYGLPSRPWLISLSSKDDWATRRVFPLGSKIGSAFAHFKPGQRELATTTGPHNPLLVNLEMAAAGDAEQPFPNGRPLTPDGEIVLDRCLESSTDGRCKGPSSGYWIVEVDQGLKLITGHNSVFNRRMMEVYLGLLQVARSFEPIDPGDLDPSLAQRFETFLCDVEEPAGLCPVEPTECRP